MKKKFSIICALALTVTTFSNVSVDSKFASNLPNTYEQIVGTRL